MKRYNNIIVVLVALLALVGCKDKMRELNTNLDLIDDTQVQYMFTGALGDWELMGSDTAPGQLHYLMQYITHYSTKRGGITYYRNPTTDNDIAVQWTNAHYGDCFSIGNKLNNILNYIDTQVAEADQPKYGDIRAICDGMINYMQYHILENFGATVYTDAFKAISDGVTQPEYEYMEDLVDEIDEHLAAAVKQLAAPAVENVQVLGAQDYFTGWKSTKKAGVRGCVISKVDNWTEQRATWKKFFNMERLDIAWKLKGQIGDAKFNQIFSEVASVSDGYFTSVDGAFFFNSKINVGNGDGNVYVTPQCCVAAPFLNLLIANEDPRLPLLARPNGATTKTSAPFVMMQTWFPDTLAKYDFLDGKHPYIGLCANPEAKSVAINDDPDNGFISKGVIYFNRLENPMYPDAFVMDCGDGFGEVEFCPSGEEYFNTSILIGSEVAYRYFLVCGGKNNANHDYSGNGIKGLGNAYKYELQADGCATNETGDPGQDLHLRRAEFSYPRQCYLLSMIGKDFGGKSKEQWYEEGVRASFQMLQDDAHRMAVQAYTGGDTFNVNRTYPSELTQTLPSGDVVINYPYSYDDATVEAYIAAHPYSKENLLDQFYIYCYNDPVTMFYFWRKTGLPEFVEFPTRQAQAAQQHIYFEKPYDGTVEMTVPRRNCLPDRNTLNANFAAIKEGLQSNPDNPNFGKWIETDGKIWWEDCSAYPTGFNWE